MGLFSVAGARNITQDGQHAATAASAEDVGAPAQTWRGVGHMEPAHHALGAAGDAPEGTKRWSTHALERIWQLHGHVARQTGATNATLAWRGQEWWRMQQQRPRGVRRPKRFNPNMDTQRQIAGVAGDQWMLLAQDRTAWQNLQGAFVQKFDPKWATGRQPSLQNLAPNKKSRGARRPPSGPTRMTPMDWGESSRLGGGGGGRAGTQSYMRGT